MATAEQGTDAYIDSQITVAVGTRLGERQMQPAYGVPDATFAVLNPADIQTCLDRYGPDSVDITDVVTTRTDEQTLHVAVNWQRRNG